MFQRWSKEFDLGMSYDTITYSPDLGKETTNKISLYWKFWFMGRGGCKLIAFYSLMSQGKTTQVLARYTALKTRQTLNSPQRPQVQPKPLPRSHRHGAWRTPRQQRDRRPRKEKHRKAIFQNNLWISLNLFWKCRYWNHPIKTSLATIPAAKKQEAPLLIHSNHPFWHWT